MKIWILWAKDDSDYFEPWYDKMFEIVVVAKNEEVARQIASKNCSYEGKQPWLLPEHTNCEEVSVDEERIVISSIRWA